jgi:hypothetical protein
MMGIHPILHLMESTTHLIKYFNLSIADPMNKHKSVGYYALMML